jgi:serine O-acetyltransferase
VRRASSRPDAPPATAHVELAERLVASGDADYRVLQEGYWPNRERVLDAIERMHRLMMAESLPGTRAAETPAARIARELADIDGTLTPQVQLAFEMPAHLGEAGAPDSKAAAAAARRVVDELFTRLPTLRDRIFDDARAAWRNDPSCRHPIEALYAYPGVFAITRHRIAHIFYELDVPLLPRLIAEDAHRRTGIDINAGATIGNEFFIDHGSGVVIGETAIVGDRVTLYQGVTLGAKSFQVDKATGRLVKGQPRHPIVEDDVTIYASATVLGRITIGRGSIIGGNVWLTHSVPPNSRISQAAPQQGGFTDGAGI